MRNLALAAALFAGVTGFAQQKIGHLNVEELLQLMPETKAAQERIRAYGEQLQNDLGEMEKELETKYQNFQANQAGMTELNRQTKARELQELQGRIQEYGQRAQEDMQNKQVEEITPIIEKANKAVQEVAKENKFTYILDSSPNKGVVIFVENGEDVMPLVKKKLNITEAPKTETKSETPAGK